jgi:uncharacterized repeat protein (TIGR01451 family)
VTAPVNAPDTDPANTTAVDVDDLTPTAVLMTDKQLITDLVRGQQAVYTISVRNNGPSVATNVSVTDVLPDALTYVSGAGSGWTCSSAASIGMSDTAQADIAPAPAPPADPAPLPRTGASPMPMLRAAAFLIALGLLIEIGGRRRRIVR